MSGAGFVVGVVFKEFVLVVEFEVKEVADVFGKSEDVASLPKMEPDVGVVVFFANRFIM